MNLIFRTVRKLQEPIVMRQVNCVALDSKIFLALFSWSWLLPERRSVKPLYSN